RIYDGQRAVVRNVSYFSQTEQAAQLVCRHILHWPRCRSGAGRRLWKRSRSRGMKRDVAFYLLQDLMNVAIEHRDGSEALEIGESLSAVFSSPTPLWIDRPQRYM